MSDQLQDFELPGDEPESPSGAADGSTPRWPWIVGALVVILALIAFFWFRREPAEPEAEPVPPAVPSAVESEPAEPSASTLEIGEVPALVDSDAWLRGLVGQISSHPQLVEWILTPELIRGFVVVVDNLAEGASPAKHLEMAAPEGEFKVRESGERVFVDPASYQRFDLLVDVVDSLDVAGSAELYAAIRPLCQEAYQDLGYPGEDFEGALEKALRRVQSVPVLDGPVELQPKVTAYEFADPALEDLTPAAKQLLRLGPENLQRLQAKLAVLARAAGLEP